MEKKNCDDPKKKSILEDKLSNIKINSQKKIDDVKK